MSYKEILKEIAPHLKAFSSARSSWNNWDVSFWPDGLRILSLPMEEQILFFPELSEMIAESGNSKAIYNSWVRWKGLDGGEMAARLMMKNKKALMNEGLRAYLKFESKFEGGGAAYESWINRISKKLKADPSLIKEVFPELSLGRGHSHGGYWITQMTVEDQVLTIKKLGEDKNWDAMLSCLKAWEGKERSLSKAVPKEAQEVLWPLVEKALLEKKAFSHPTHEQKGPLYPWRPDFMTKMLERAKTKPNESANWIELVLRGEGLTGKAIAVVLKFVFETAGIDAYMKTRLVQQALWHPAMTLETSTQIMEILGGNTKHSAAGNGDIVHAIILHWPEVMDDKKIMGKFFKAGQMRHIYWHGMLANPTVTARPRALQIIVEKLSTESYGISAFMSWINKNQHLIESVPWNLLLDPKQKMASTTRFKLHALASRAGVTSLATGEKPLELLEKRVDRIRSGHSAAAMLLEFSKDGGTLLQRINGEKILRLFRLAALSASNWEMKTWAELITLKDIKLGDEPEPKLLHEALRIYLRPHVKAGIVGGDNNQFRYNLKREEEREKQVMNWFLPPLTNSKEVPEVLTGMAPRLRRQFARILMNRPYKTELERMTEEEVVAKLEALNKRESKVEIIEAVKDGDGQPKTKRASKASKVEAETTTIGIVSTVNPKAKQR